MIPRLSLTSPRAAIWSRCGPSRLGGVSAAPRAGSTGRGPGQAEVSRAPYKRRPGRLPTLRRRAVSHPEMAAALRYLALALLLAGCSQAAATDQQADQPADQQADQQAEEARLRYGGYGIGYGYDSYGRYGGGYDGYGGLGGYGRR